ncbi:MAG: insulinase family protein [Candidatus Solibacter usitatus]|nr:insulinase family protein [Candidatus Solibacter usitatus]
MTTPTLNRDIAVSSLSNGIRVISEPMPSVRSVAAGFWIGTGSRSEEPAENGTSHFIEHMLFKGTPRRSAEDIAREVDAIGGHLDAFTGRELVGYNTKVVDEHLPIAFEILADMMLNPRFDAGDIEKEKGVVLEELKMETDNPESFVHELFVHNFWRRHPLGRPILGTKKTIAGFNDESLRSYHNRYYRPENLTITAAGSLRHEELVQLAEEHFGCLPVGGEVPRLRAPAPEAPLVLKNRRSLQQVHVCLGMPLHPATHPLRFACYTLNVILGGGMSSRLFQNIRERQGLAYSIFSELNLYQDAGMMAVYAGTSAETAQRLLENIMLELRRLKNDALPAGELKHAKDHMKGSLMLSLESTTSRMGNLARQWMNFGRFYTLDELAESIEAVTADQVQDVAREFFTSEKIGLTMLGPLDGVKAGREDLVC